jgi:hypothetical protein
VSVKDSIVWANTPDQISSNPSVDYSDVQGGFPGTGNIDADPLFENDYSLSSTSPCIEVADPADLSCNSDHHGNPRRLDAHLSGVLRADMGAVEWSNVLLAVSGVATPGGVLTITTSGTAGLSVILFAASQPGVACVFPYGTLFFSFAGPWAMFPWGQIPSSVTIHIPASLPTPLPLVLQELARDPLDHGNASNGVALTIE